MDRLSSLDDAILTKIISYLPTTKDAVRTSVLCRSFRQIWTNVTSLVFVLATYNDGLLIDHVISNRNHHHRLDRLAIIYSTSWIDFAAFLPAWVDYGIRHRLRHVTLHLRPNSATRFLHEIFSVPYLETLDLRLMMLPSPLQPPRLSHLKFLSLRDIDNISDEFVRKLFSGSPLLEDLSLDGRFDSLDVSFPGLRRLRLKVHVKKLVDDPITGSKIRVRCPRLERFDFSYAHVGGVYEADLPLLSEARVSRFGNDSHLDALPGSLQNASVLHFTPLDFKQRPRIPVQLIDCILATLSSHTLFVDYRRSVQNFHYLQDSQELAVPLDLLADLNYALKELLLNNIILATVPRLVIENFRNIYSENWIDFAELLTTGGSRDPFMMEFERGRSNYHNCQPHISS